MEPNGPTWTNRDRKGYQKGAKSDQNGAKGTKSAPKGNQRNKKKRCSEKVGPMMAPGRKGYGLGSLLRRKSRPKGAFLEIPKIENGTKIQFVSKDRPRDPLKRDSGSGFEKTWKNNEISIEK
jgi:hypothetical protein